MYLKGSKLISGYSFSEPKDREMQKKILDIVLEGKDYNIELESTMSVRIPIGYWRKANQIHAWFVDNCAHDGVDDCTPMYPQREQIEELLTLVKNVLENPEAGPEELPTRSGFFFGSIDYDEYYISDLKDTVTILERALKMLDDKVIDYIIYEASW